MARTYQSEGWYKFPPLWSAGTEVSCRGQFRIAAMSVTAVLEGRVLNSRPVTLLYTYLPCPLLPPFALFLSLSLSLSLVRFHYLFSFYRTFFSFLLFLLALLALRLFRALFPIEFASTRPVLSKGKLRPGSVHLMGHAYSAQPIGNHQADKLRVLY